jgi:hypothetical protein
MFPRARASEGRSRQGRDSCPLAMSEANRGVPEDCRGCPFQPERLEWRALEDSRLAVPISGRICLAA